MCGQTRAAMTSFPHLASKAKRCRFCGTKLDDRQPVARPGVCVSANCRRQLSLEEAEASAQREWDETLRRSREQIADGAADIIAEAASHGLTADQILAVAVPLLARPQSALDAQSREQFVEHVRHIVARSFEDAAPVPETSERSQLEAPVNRYFGAACATCMGACCEIGRGYMAFLSAETITQYRRHVPHLSADEVIDTYIDRLPDKITEGSCYFHGSRGCTLDREQRDDVCHRHFCLQVRVHRAAQIDREPGPLIILAADQEGNRAVTFLGAGGRGEVSPRPDRQKPKPTDAQAIADRAIDRLPATPPAPQSGAPPLAPLCQWCAKPISPVQAALTNSCGDTACELARRQHQ